MRSESDFEPSYVLTSPKRKIHRVKVLGTVRSVPIFGTDNAYARFQLDDATGVIWVSAFHTRVAMIERIAQGDMVQLVATVNEYRGKLELVAECIRKVDPNFWLLHRAEIAVSELESRREYEGLRSAIQEKNVLEAKEIASEVGIGSDLVESAPDEIGSEEVEEDLRARVLDLIFRLDSGRGVALKDILEGLKGSHSAEEVESELSGLLEEGEIYEPTVGKYAKV